MTTTVRHICACGAERQHQCPLYWPPAETRIEAHPTTHRWYVEIWEVDRWMLTSSFGDDQSWAEKRAAALRARFPEARFRIVRETTSHDIHSEDPSVPWQFNGSTP